MFFILATVGSGSPPILKPPTMNQSNVKTLTKQKQNMQTQLLWMQTVVAELTICKNNKDMTMGLKNLFSNSFLYVSHLGQKALKDGMQICSSVSLFKLKHRHRQTHS